MSSTKQLPYHKQMEYKDCIIIDGYMREMNHVLFTNTISFYKNIPSVINQLCMQYYHILRDRFDPILHDEGISITEDTATRMPTDQETRECAFLSHIVSSDTHHWQFKLSKMPNSRAYWYIGVYKVDKAIKKHEKEADPMDDVICAFYYNTNKHTCYGMNLQFGEWRGGVFGSDVRFAQCKQNDVVDMYLDLKKLKFNFGVNGKVNEQDAVDIEETRYRACVCFVRTNSDDQIQLTLYETY